jgi:hypothetical protein
MILPDLLIRTAVFSALSGITHSGKAVGVFDEAVPPNYAGPKIIIQGQSNEPDSSKLEFGYRHEMIISIIDQMPTPTGRKRTEEITNTVLSRLTPIRPGKPILSLPTSFTLWDIQLADTRDMDLVQPEQCTYRKVLTIHFLLTAL